MAFLFLPAYGKHRGPLGNVRKGVLVILLLFLGFEYFMLFDGSQFSWHFTSCTRNKKSAATKITGEILAEVLNYMKDLVLCLWPYYVDLYVMYMH